MVSPMNEADEAERDRLCTELEQIDRAGLSDLQRFRRLAHHVAGRDFPVRGGDAIVWHIVSADTV